MSTPEEIAGVLEMVERHAPRNLARLALSADDREKLKQSNLLRPLSADELAVRDAALGCRKQPGKMPYGGIMALARRLDASGVPVDLNKVASDYGVAPRSLAYSLQLVRRQKEQPSSAKMSKAMEAAIKEAEALPYYRRGAWTLVAARHCVAAKALMRNLQARGVMKFHVEDRAAA